MFKKGDNEQDENKNKRLKKDRTPSIAEQHWNPNSDKLLQLVQVPTVQRIDDAVVKFDNIGDVLDDILEYKQHLVDPKKEMFAPMYGNCRVCHRAGPLGYMCNWCTHNANFVVEGAVHVIRVTKSNLIIDALYLAKCFNVDVMVPVGKHAKLIMKETNHLCERLTEEDIEYHFDAFLMSKKPTTKDLFYKLTDKV